MTIEILIGDVFDQIAKIQTASVDCVVTSPPYWGLRSYLKDDDPLKPREIGLERTLGEHLDVLVRVFRDIRRVLKPHGTVWLNYGDCYATSPNGRAAADVENDDRTFRDKPFSTIGPVYNPNYATARGKFFGSELGDGTAGTRRVDHGGRVQAGGFLKNKDLCMIPNRLAIALQDDGWYVRSEIIWHKPNPMPESIYDRPTVAHEKIWLLTKSERYFYNAEAIREPVTGGAHARVKKPGPNSRQNVVQVPESRRGRKKVPAGWDTSTGDGRHGEVMPDRKRKSDTGVGWGRQDRVHAGSVDRGRGRIKNNASYDEAMADNAGKTDRARKMRGEKEELIKSNARFAAATQQLAETKNARNVWSISPKAFKDAHFATFPPALAKRCILAGTPPSVCGACGAVDQCGGLCAHFDRKPGVVLDPFGGAGTVGLVARGLGLSAVLIELNAEYAAMAERRIFANHKEAAE